MTAIKHHRIHKPVYLVACPSQRSIHRSFLRKWSSVALRWFKLCISGGATSSVLVHVLVHSNLSPPYPCPDPRPVPCPDLPRRSPTKAGLRRSAAFPSDAGIPACMRAGRNARATFRVLWSCGLAQRAQVVDTAGILWSFMAESPIGHLTRPKEKAILTHV